jgi:hypothetical protein
MPVKPTNFRFSDALLRDIDWLAEQNGGMDRTNLLRALVAEAKAKKLEEMKQPKLPRTTSKPHS